MSLLVTVSHEDPTPPYEQLRRQIAELIELGRLRANDRLPPVRQLANDLGLAPGTVARSYRELESRGMLVTRRGAGTRVTDQLAPPDQVRRAKLTALAERYFQQARALGFDDEEIRGAINGP